MAKKKKLKKNKTEGASAPSSLGMSAAYNRLVDVVEKELRIDSGLEVSPRLSTGVLSLDLMHGGGLGYGMTIFVGKEQSAKTTSGITVLGQALENQIPLKAVFDAENALDPRYAQNILTTTTKLPDLSALMGSRNRKTGKWDTYPSYFYYDLNTIEPIFKVMHKLLSNLPNKRRRNDQWFLVFDKSREQQTLMNEMGLASDKSLSDARFNWCPVEDDRPQAFFMVDALNALVVEAVDEEEETGNAMALEARVLGRWLRFVRGKMRRKGAVFVAVNQLRDAPGVKFGSPEYETSGNAPKQFSDIRVRFASRVPPDGFQRDKEAGGLCIEPSIIVPGGHDRYAFKGLSNIKNKLGTPFRKSGMRVWVSDARGKAYGIDPVYDVYRFCSQLNGIEKIGKGKGAFKITVDDPLFAPVKDTIFDMQTLKAVVLAEVLGGREYKDIVEKKGLPKIALRKRAFKMIKSGSAETLYQKAIAKADSSEDE